MAKISTKQFAELLLEITQEKSQKDLPKILDSYMKLLQKNKALSRINLIIKKFTELHNKTTNTVDVKIYSKEKISEENEQAISNKFKKLFNTDNILINNILDKTISGGVKITTKDIVIDLTLDNKVNQLKNYLIKYS